MPRPPVAAALVGALTLASCGGQEAEGPTGPPEPSAEASAPDDRSSRPVDGGSAPEGHGGRAGEPSGQSGSAAGERCAFTAPEGRLARDVVTIELDGLACEEALPLARAAALGQPAGANLTIESHGFECEPSSATKGANVTYECTGDGGSAAFDVVWSEPAE